MYHELTLAEVELIDVYFKFECDLQFKVINFHVSSTNVLSWVSSLLQITFVFVVAC